MMRRNRRWPAMVLALALAGGSALPAQATDTPTPTSALTLSPTPTSTVATATPTLTATPTRTGTPVLVPCAGVEAAEPNDSGWGCVLAVGATVKGNIDPARDVDWYEFYGKAGRYYRLTATAVITGLDPNLTVTQVDGAALAYNDDRAPGDVTAEVALRLDMDGYYLVAVMGPPQNIFTGTYTLQLNDIQPTATPTPSASPLPSATSPASATPRISATAPYNDAASAAEAQVGKSAEGTITGDDPVDWWALRVKPGVTYECKVSGDFDPTLRVEQGGQILGYNDDAVPGQPAAAVRWNSNLDGLAYLVVQSTFGTGRYQLACAAAAATVLPAATARPPATASPAYTATPMLPAATLPPPVSPTPAASWRLIGPVAAPTVGVITLNITVYYDINNSGAPEPGEGVEGLSIRALSGGQSVNWALTNAQGEARLVIVGPADRVGAPFLGLYAKVRVGETRDIVWRITAVRLPTFLVVEK